MRRKVARSKVAVAAIGLFTEFNDGDGGIFCSFITYDFHTKTC